MALDENFPAILYSLKSYAKALAGQDCEDLLHDTAERAMEHAEEFLWGSLKDWLRTLMYRIYADQYRHNIVRRKYVSRELAKRQKAPTAGHNADSRGTRRIHLEPATPPTQEVAAQIMEAWGYIEGLRSGRKEALVANLMGGTYQEIAEEMDLPLGTVARRIHEARKTLQVLI